MIQQRTMAEAFERFLELMEPFQPRRVITPGLIIGMAKDAVNGD